MLETRTSPSPIWWWTGSWKCKKHHHPWICCERKTDNVSKIHTSLGSHRVNNRKWTINTKQRKWLRVELFIRQLIYQPSPVWCCKLEQPRREGMCLKCGASPSDFIRHCKPTYLRYEDLKDILCLKAKNTAIRKKRLEINFNANKSTKSLIYRCMEMRARGSGADPEGGHRGNSHGQNFRIK